MKHWLLLLLTTFTFAAATPGESSLGFDIEKPLLADYYSLDPDISEIVEEKLRKIRDRYEIDIRVWIYGQRPVPKNRVKKIEYNRDLRRPFWLKVHEKFQEYDIGQGYKGGLLAAINVGSREVKVEATLNIENIFTPEFVDYTEAIMFRPYFNNDNIQGGVVALVDFIDFRIKQYLQGDSFAPDAYKKGIEKKRALEQWWAKHNTPDAVMRKFVEFLNSENLQDTLSLMTKKSRKMLMKAPMTTDEILDIEYDARVCMEPRTITSFSGNYAVIRYSIDQGSCRPWFFRSEDGFWKIDYYEMRRQIGKDAITGKVQLRGWQSFPYRFAYYDVTVNRRGSLVPKSFKIGVVVSEEKGIAKDGHNVIVFKVVEGTPAWAAGVLPGDIVLALNDKVIRTAKEYEDALQAIRHGNPFRIKVRRSEGVDRFREYEFQGVAR